MFRVQKLRRLREPVIYFGLSMIILIWTGVILEIRNQFAAVEQSSSRDALNYARVFEENVLRSLRQIDTQLWFVSSSAGRKDSGLWQEIMRELPVDKELTVQLALVNADGMVAASTVANWSGRPLDLRDREHIRVHLDQKTEGLFISRPVLGRLSGKWSLQLSRAIRNKDGAITGVAVASFDPSHISRFYDSMGLQPGGAITLLGLDGVVRASAGASASVFGHDLKGSPLLASISSGKEGTLAAPLWGDTKSLTSWRRLDGMNLAVAVSVASMSGTGASQAWSTFLVFAAAFVSILIALASLRMAHAHQLLTLSEVRLQRSKRQIREQSQHLKLTLENISQGIAMTDPRGRIVVANGTLLKMLSPRDAAPPSDLANTLKQIIKESQPLSPAGTEETTSASSTYETAGGRILKIVTASVAGDGRVVTFEDITERRQRQLQLEAARQTANAANRAKSEFLASMSHEIRTPMHGIIGMSQVLLESKVSAEQRKSIETIAASGESLMTIINDILDYSRIEAGKLELRPVICNLRSTLDELATLMSARAKDRDLELELNYPAGLPELFNADMGRIRQVVTNMLGNAVKFTTGPNVQINVSQRETGEMSIAVKDTGPGISESQIAVIFDEFTQLNAPANRKYAGTGLGLPISRKLAALMGGELTVESALGVGSTFTFTIRLPVAAPAAAVLPAVAAELVKLPAIHTNLGRPVRILAAEDNKTNRQVLCSMLKTEAVEIILAIDGEEAVEKYKTDRPDIILMDLWMPNVDGFQATNQIRALERELGLDRTPIVALTANAVRGDRDKCLAADFDDYMSKPLYKRVLLEMINRWSGQPRKEGDRFLLEPLYFREKRQLSNATKSAESRDAQFASNVDQQRIAVLAADLGAANFERAVVQFRTDVRAQLAALERAKVTSGVEEFRTAVEEIRSCSRNLGCVRLVNSCESMLKTLTGEGVIPAATIEELNVVFQSTAKDLSGMATPAAAAASKLSA